MKSFNRILIILLIFTIIISTCGAYAASDTSVIYDDITSTQITSGISRDSKGVVQSIPIISKTTYNGWAYAEADLTNISRPATSAYTFSVFDQNKSQQILLHNGS